MGFRPLVLPHSEQGWAQLKRTLGGTGVSGADEAGPSTGNPDLPAPTFFCLMTPTTATTLSLMLFFQKLGWIQGLSVATLR